MLQNLLLALFLSAPLPTDTVLVARVIDGDTFVTADSERVRLIGVDAPELHRGPPESRARGERARAWLDSLITGKTVVLEMDSRAIFDRFCRRLAYVSLDGEEIAPKLLRLGLAQPLTKYPFDRSARFRDLSKQ